MPEPRLEPVATSPRHSLPEPEPLLDIGQELQELDIEQELQEHDIAQEVDSARALMQQSALLRQAAASFSQTTSSAVAEEVLRLTIDSSCVVRQWDFDR